MLVVRYHSKSADADSYFNFLGCYQHAPSPKI